MASARIAEPGRWSTQRIVFGDWNPVVRDGIDVLRGLFFAGTAVFILMGRSTSVGLVVASIVLVIARLVNLPRPYDLGLIMGLALIAYGTAFNLYGRVDHYDKVVHGLSTFFWAPVLYIVLVRLDVLPDLDETKERHALVGIFIVTTALGLAVGAGYEIAEWALDRVLGWSLIIGETDTATDLIADLTGAAAGGALLVAWNRWGWSTVRRETPSEMR